MIALVRNTNRPRLYVTFLTIIFYWRAIESWSSKLLILVLCSVFYVHVLFAQWFKDFQAWLIEPIHQKYICLITSFKGFPLSRVKRIEMASQERLPFSCITLDLDIFAFVWKLEKEILEHAEIIKRDGGNFSRERGRTVYDQRLIVDESN